MCRDEISVKCICDTRCERLGENRRTRQVKTSQLINGCVVEIKGDCKTRRWRKSACNQNQAVLASSKSLHLQSTAWGKTNMQPNTNCLWQY